MDRERLRQHLKHILFNDYIGIYEFGMLNHNASDRSMCYDIFETHVASPDFEALFAESQQRYELYRKGYLTKGEVERLGHLAGPQELPTPLEEWIKDDWGCDDPDQYADEIATKYMEWRDAHEDEARARARKVEEFNPASYSADSPAGS